MAGFWTHRFNVVLRPLRELNGQQTAIVLEARTAAQATREATLRHPDMKVVQVSRVLAEVPVLAVRGGQTGSASTSDDLPSLSAQQARRA